MSKNLIDKVFEKMRPLASDPDYRVIWHIKTRLHLIDFADNDFSLALIEASLKGDLSLDVIKIIKDSYADLDSFLASSAKDWKQGQKMTPRMNLQLVTLQYKIKFGVR